jgi:RNA polymerase sigma factor (sigma-70 family)
MVDVEQLYRDCAAKLERALRSRFSRAAVPDALVEDACAQAWAIAWRERGRIEPDHPFAWLVVVATNELFGLLRKRRFETNGEGAEAALDHRAAKHADPELALEARAALEALHGLKPNQCQALALRVGGYRYQEIEALLGRTYTWVNRHVTEGTKALRETSSE